ncbi:MAG: glutamate racemase [Tissierellia bacterium]|nr:glutamate racemase [Tissierellia bacterium]
MSHLIFFDSGVGGLTAFFAAAKMFPYESMIYYGDTLEVPYGPKPDREIIALMDQFMKKILPYEPKAVTLACNTATVAASGYLRKHYQVPIIGMEPAIKPALERLRNPKERVLLFSTETTARSLKLKKLVKHLRGGHQLIIEPLPELVTLAEEGKFQGPEVEAFLDRTLAAHDLERIRGVVLGCTHFIWYRKLFQERLPEGTHLVDGNAGTLRQLSRKFRPKNRPGTPRELLLHFTGPISPVVPQLIEEHLGGEGRIVDRL